MMGHNICFYEEIWLIILKLSQLPVLIWSNVLDFNPFWGIVQTVQTGVGAAVGVRGWVGIVDHDHEVTILVLPVSSKS